MNNNTHFHSSPRSTGAKRKQVKNACVNCQKACKKCDDQRPCGRCVKYGIEDTCINSQRKERKRKDASSASESASERSSSPLSMMSSRSARLRQRESLRSSARNIRSFPKELLQSLQDEEDHDHDHEHDNHEHQSFHSFHQQQRAAVALQPTEDFKALAQLCSELHTIFLAAAQQPQLPRIPLNQSYPMPLPAMHFHHQQQQPLYFSSPVAVSTFGSESERSFLNRTPPEDDHLMGMPSPAKSNDSLGKF